MDQGKLRLDGGPNMLVHKVCEGGIVRRSELRKALSAVGEYIKESIYSVTYKS